MSTPKVFISYSHDSEEHSERVRALGASLARDGCECRIDIYKDTDEDWPAWMTRQLIETDFVLCVVTETYTRRFSDKELPDVGLGVGWEAGLIRRLLYAKKLRNERIFPVVFTDSDRPQIPLELQGYDFFLLNGQAGYETLLRKLLNQPLHARPEIGTPPDLGINTTAPLFARPSVRPSPVKPRAAPAPEAPTLTPTVGRPRVYISYAWRERLGPERALKLADQLRMEGIDARIDCYYRENLHGFIAPPLLQRGEDAWTRWQEEQIRNADRVLVICGPQYANSLLDSGVGRDLRFMEEDLKRPGVELRKFVPVGFAHYLPNKQNIPQFLQGANYYDLARGSKIGGLKDLIRQFRNEFPLQASAALVQGSPTLPRDSDSMPATADKVQANRQPRQPTSSMQPPIDFVIITPLEEEREAMLAHLGNPKRLPPGRDDIRVYYPSTVPVTFTDGSIGNYKVVLTDLLGMGRLEAANAVGDAIRRWQPTYIVLVGIAGGLASAGVNVGDVLISEQIADYELQKLTPEKAHIRWSVHRAAPRLLGASKQVRAEEWRSLIREARPEAGLSQRHTGPICTGDKVIANGLMDQYQDVWTKLIGVEMEAGGVASAAFQAASAPGFFMVRGVSDLADAEKDKPQTHSWRAYACDVAAAYFLAFLKSGPVPANP